MRPLLRFIKNWPQLFLGGVLALYAAIYVGVGVIVAVVIFSDKISFLRELGDPGKLFLGVGVVGLIKVALQWLPMACSQERKSLPTFALPNIVLFAVICLMAFFPHVNWGLRLAAAIGVALLFHLIIPKRMHQTGDDKRKLHVSRLDVLLVCFVGILWLGMVANERRETAERELQKIEKDVSLDVIAAMNDRRALVHLVFDEDQRDAVRQAAQERLAELAEAGSSIATPPVSSTPLPP